MSVARVPRVGWGLVGGLASPLSSYPHPHLLAFFDATTIYSITMFSQATRSIASAAARRAAVRSTTRAASSVSARVVAAPLASKLSGLALLAATTTAAIVKNNQDNTVVSCDKLPVYGVPGTNQERTFLAVKPDGVQRGLVGDIIARFEKRGYKLVGLKLVWPTLEMAQNHYKDLAKKPFYPGTYCI